MRLLLLGIGAVPAYGCLQTWLDKNSFGYAACESASEGTIEGAHLKLVQVVFRHGARTPLSPLYWEGSSWNRVTDCGQEYDAVRLALKSVNGGPAPTSQHDQKQVSTILPGGCSKGELTRLGQQQALDVGKFLRQRYVEQHGLLPAAYQEGILTGRTTNFARTVATLRGILTGLYPGTQAEVLITTASDDDEILYGNVRACERLGVLFKARTAMLKEQLSRRASLEQLQQQVRKAMSLPADHEVAFVELNDALTSLRFHSKAIAPGLTPELLQAIEREATLRMKGAIAPRWDHPDSQDDLRLGMGRLIAELASAMEAVDKGQAGPKLRLYSAHDTTVLPILQMLQHDTEEWPPYVANIVFELWQRPSKGWLWSSGKAESFVRVLYNGQPLQLPGSRAGYEAPLADFLAACLTPYILDAADQATACSVAVEPASVPKPSPQGQAASGDSLQGL